MTILNNTDDAVIIGNIAADADSENYLHLDEINSISILCKSSDLLPNQTKTNVMLFATQCKTQILNSFLQMAQWLLPAKDLIILAQQWTIDWVLRRKSLIKPAISHFYKSMWKRQQVNPLYIHNCGFDCAVKDRMNSFISDIHVKKDEYQTPPLIFDRTPIWKAAIIQISSSSR